MCSVYYIYYNYIYAYLERFRVSWIVSIHVSDWIDDKESFQLFWKDADAVFFRGNTGIFPTLTKSSSEITDGNLVLLLYLSCYSQCMLDAGRYLWATFSLMDFLYYSPIIPRWFLPSIALYYQMISILYNTIIFDLPLATNNDQLYDQIPVYFKV